MPPLFLLLWNSMEQQVNQINAAEQMSVRAVILGKSNKQLLNS